MHDLPFCLYFVWHEKELYSASHNNWKEGYVPADGIPFTLEVVTVATGAKAVPEAGPCAEPTGALPAAPTTEPGLAAGEKA